MHNVKQAAEDELLSLSNAFLKCDGDHPVEDPQEESAEPVLVGGKGDIFFFHYCPECCELDRKRGFTVLSIPQIMQEFAKLKHPHNESTACNCDPTPKTDFD